MDMAAITKSTSESHESISKTKAKPKNHKAFILFWHPLLNRIAYAGY